jgi:hypothetical protein
MMPTRKPPRLCESCETSQYRHRVLLPSVQRHLHLCRKCFNRLMSPKDDFTLAMHFNGMPAVVAMVQKHCRACGGTGEAFEGNDWMGFACRSCGGGGGYPEYPLRAVVRPHPDHVMRHADAARALVNSRPGYNAKADKEFEVYAFLSVFHPEYDHADKRAFIREMGD